MAVAACGGRLRWSRAVLWEAVLWPPGLIRTLTQPSCHVFVCACVQDPHRVPQWYQKYMLQYQSLAGIYIIEDRFQGGYRTAYVGSLCRLS